ncbi:hypothetical protein EJ04DRAFT_432166 [Polyplosphaeria fusca]|uniref:HOOK N-terminal domain-containing protein n=1 Tax=Polyplosphaeria fusca TaxID=682080 RepID=A0A9P4R4P0_9PLEO|nr:hypothetical protein EJ04DRAFT_432166 [Polyplosphaeria fusca]
MDDFKPEQLKALLDWVNTFDLPPPGRVTAWNQLEDGQLLWQILSDVDPDYFSESLPNFDESHRRTSNNWIPLWQNLKHIERAVSTYIREECEQLPVLTKRMIPELKTGVRDGSMMLTAKLTMAVLLASVFSPKSNTRMVKVMSELGTKTAETIAGAIQEMQQLDQRMAALGVDQELTPEPNPSGYRTPTRAASGTQSTLERDSGLEQEALLFEANKDRAALRAQVARLQEDLERGKGRVSQLEEELVEARLHLDTRPKSSYGNIEQLQNDLTRDRQYIMELETDLANAKDVVDSQKRRLDRLTADEPSKQDMRDQLQLIRAERDELAQKAKANENLKKKIENLTKEAKTVEQLREQYQTARERLQALEDVEERNAALEKVNKENSQTIVQCEQSIFEEKGKRTRVEHENLQLMKVLEQTRELQYKAEEARRELEERLESSSSVPRGGSLEDELNQDESVDNLDEPASAKTIMASSFSADGLALQQKVDILNARLKSLEAETLKQMQDNLGLRSDIMSTKDEESQRPFLEQSEKLHTAEAQLEELMRKFREKDAEAAELRNNLNKKSDVEEDVKNKTLQAEYDRLLAVQQRTNQRLRDVELNNGEKTGLLRAALLDRENLSPELLALKNAELERLIREKIEGVLNAPAEARPKALDAESSDIAQRVIRSQAALDMAKKVSYKQFPSSRPVLSSDDSGGTASNRTVTAPTSSAHTGLNDRSRHGGLESSISVAGIASHKLGSMIPLFRRHKTTASVSGSANGHGNGTPSSSDLDEQRAANDTLREELEKTKKESAEKGSIELQQEVEHLRRENKLITSAWYDMTTRLQSNTVILQRKSEAPKSWLGKQRGVVGGPTNNVCRFSRLHPKLHSPAPNTADTTQIRR